jgi:hypothetical protein
MVVNTFNIDQCSLDCFIFYYMYFLYLSFSRRHGLNQGLPVLLTNPNFIQNFVFCYEKVYLLGKSVIKLHLELAPPPPPPPSANSDRMTTFLFVSVGEYGG